ncbi:MAG TPA: metal-dependent transcriptional regulator [Clostridiaceae bacterium]|nr:metal-dependent transcriptional regulator [Clostridiaceae bacterium]
MNSSREDYIIAIYRLTKKADFVNSVTIAKKLGVSRASVSEMVKKLCDDKLINFEQNRISLTEAGMTKARNIISCHRLWEYFLTEILGMSSDEAHEQADLLEHVTGENLKDALNEYLNYPEQSPRGNVIWDNVENMEDEDISENNP